MYRTLNLKNRSSKLYGAYATYFRLSNGRGVKVYNLSEFCDSDGKRSKYMLNFGTVELDFAYIQSIQCSIVPKIFEIVAVKVKGLWYPGIIMEHVQGVDLYEYTKRHAKRHTLLSDYLIRASNLFTNLTGYIHEDLHGYNVIVDKKTKQYKVIDLTWDTATRSVRI